MKKLIQLMILGGLVFGGWQANLRWEEFKPVLAELEEKHPGKYAKWLKRPSLFTLKKPSGFTMKLNP